MLKRTRRTFITSDTHFGHSNIIKYCKRPYHVEGGNQNPANIPEVQRMNEDILQLFDRLPENCDIWHLGDFWFAGNRHSDFDSDAVHKGIEDFVYRIRKGNDNRRLFLVLGNHDNGKRAWNIPNYSKSRIDYYKSRGFDEVYDTPVLLEDKWILSHEPVWIEPGSHFVNLYGHTHGLVIPGDYFCYDQENYAQQVREGIVPEMKWPERKVNLENYKNVCLDHWHGIPEWKGDMLYVDERHKLWWKRE